MRILHIHPAMRGGGIEAMICGLANEMANSNDVTVCCMFEPTVNDIFWNRLSPKVTRISLGKTKEGISFEILISIIKLIRKGNYDVVHFHGFFYYYILPVFFYKSTEYFYTVHSDARMENGTWSKYILPLKKWAFIKGYVHPITISQASNQSFKALYGIDGHIIENGIPKPIVNNRPNIVDKMRLSLNTRVFVHAGRITKAKNQVVLCRVFSSLIAAGHDVVLLIAGSKQDETIFGQLIPFFSDRIVYLGERNDISQLFFKSDGFCLPSIWEGLPITLLEALSVGCIPICSPVGGIISVIKPGINGMLSESSSEEDFYQTMLDFLNLSTAEINRMKQSCIETYSHYSIEETAHNYLLYYKDIIG